jgi:hypothetical protein
MLKFAIEYWLGAVFLGVITIGTWIFNYYKKRFTCRFEEHDMLKVGLQSLLRTEIIKSYNYYKEKEYCPIYAKDSIAAMGKAYHNLGGNGTTVKLLEDVADMPTEKKYVNI